MITVYVKGGLGNQMFQYASAYALARRLSQHLTLDISFYPKQSLRGFKLSNFCISNDVLQKESGFPLQYEVLKNKYVNKAIRMLKHEVTSISPDCIYLVESTKDLVDSFFTVNASDIYLNGYFQSEDYFKKYREELIKQFTPNYKQGMEYNNALSNIEMSNSIAIHVRRGDFKKQALSDRKAQLHYLLGEVYYRDAIKRISNSVENPSFFCFSDDIEWARNSFGDLAKIQFVTLKTDHADIDEMMLMRNCKHIITANSTFSWWAAWLNEHENAIRIVPDKRYGTVRMIPDNWIKIPVE